MHAKHLRLVSIDVEVDRWIRRRERAEHAGQLWVLRGRRGEPANDLSERFRVAAAQIAAAGAETEDGRRRQGDNRSALDLAELGAQAGNQLRRSERTILAFFERLERDHHKGGVRLRVVIDEVQTDDRGEVRDRFFLAQHVLGPTNDVRGPGNRCAARQLNYDEERALIILWQKTGRCYPRQTDDAEACDHDHRQADDGKLNDSRDRSSIAIAYVIDRPHDEPDRPSSGSVVGAEAALRKAPARA